MNSNPTANSSASTSASADAISRRAYEIWEKEGRPEGSDLRHWLQAEQELGVSVDRAGQDGAAGAQASSNGNARAGEAGARNANTDRPLANKVTGASARESKRPTTTPFERGPSTGGAQPAGTKRR